MARVFLVSAPDPVVAALRDTIIAFAPGLPGYALVAVLTRALYARGLWKSPTVCVVGGWLLAVAADVVLAQLLPAENRGLALAAGHSLGVTVAGLALLVAVARTVGSGGLAGVGRVGTAALAAAALAAAGGLLTTRALDADPVPDGLLSAVGAGLLGAALVLVIALSVMMGTARRPVAAAWRALRAAERPVSTEPTGTTGARQEVHGD
jgi:putative peptidoglycan lipid II flippase